MMIIGCDHPGFQQIAFVDTDTGELREQRLQHHEEAEKFYRDLAAQGMKVRVGMEASGHKLRTDWIRGTYQPPAGVVVFPTSAPAMTGVEKQDQRARSERTDQPHLSRCSSTPWIRL